MKGLALTLWTEVLGSVKCTMKADDLVTYVGLLGEFNLPVKNKKLVDLIID